MSMKRTKKSSSATKGSQSEGSMGFNPPTTVLPKWEEATAEKPDEAFVPYALSRTFTRSELVLHPKFGKGVVVGVDGARIEVLFSDGVRKLAHGVASA